MFVTGDHSIASLHCGCRFYLLLVNVLCRLEVWPGYITAVQEQEGGLMLLLDASHKVLRTETVHDIM